MCKVKDGMSAQIDDLVNEHYGVAHMAQAMNAAANNNQGNGSYRSGPGGLIYEASKSQFTHNNTGAQSTIKIQNGVITDITTGPIEQPTTKTNEGIKHDNEKPDLSLLSSMAIIEVGKVMTFGKKKYTANNWRGGIVYTRLIAAALRHIFAFLGGESTDPESGISHAAHAICCLMMLLEFQQTRPDLDDRYKQL